MTSLDDPNAVALLDRVEAMLQTTDPDTWWEIVEKCTDCDQYGRLDDLSPCPHHPPLKEAVNG